MPGRHISRCFSLSRQSAAELQQWHIFGFNPAFSKPLTAAVKRAYCSAVKPSSSSGVRSETAKWVNIPSNIKPGKRAAFTASVMPERLLSRQSNPILPIPVSILMCILILSPFFTEKSDSAAAYSVEKTHCVISFS